MTQCDHHINISLHIRTYIRNVRAREKRDNSPRMICTAAVTGWAELKMEWERVLVCPHGTIPSLRVGWTGMNLARLRLTPALYWAWNRSPLSSSLKRPSPPTPTILGQREKGMEGGGRGGREGMGGKDVPNQYNVRTYV